MVERPKPDDPFITRMEAKRQAEWEARLARETTNDKITASACKKLGGWVKYLWKELPAFVLSFSSLLGLAGLLYVCWFLVKAVWEPLIAIAPIPIPKELAERGYTPEIVAERLHSAMTKLGKVAIIGDSLVAEQSRLPNIVVPNIGLSVETLATSIRHFLHLEGRLNVSGEITNPQKNLLLRLQIDEQDFDPDPVPGVLEAPDDLFAQAAKEVLVKVIERDLKDASSYNNLGVALGDLGKTDQAIVRGRNVHCWTPPAQIRASPIKALGSYLGYLTAKRAHNVRPSVRVPAPVTRFPGPVPGTCFAGPRSPRSPSLAPPAPQRIAPPCSSAS